MEEAALSGWRQTVKGKNKKEKFLFYICFVDVEKLRGLYLLF